MKSNLRPLKTLKKNLLALSLATILLLSLGLKLNNIGHLGFGSVDECCHALVAKNLLKHPFKPMLIEVPYLPYNPAIWTENHIWLHKPILPLWQIALSYWLLGVNTLLISDRRCKDALKFTLEKPGYQCLYSDLGYFLPT